MCHEESKLIEYALHTGRKVNRLVASSEPNIKVYNKSMDTLQYITCRSVEWQTHTVIESEQAKKMQNSTYLITRSYQFERASESKMLSLDRSNIDTLEQRERERERESE
jgi:hypothetical protein